MSVSHIFIFAVISSLLWVVPIANLLRRLGYSPIWAIVGFVPFVGVILLWVVSFMPWRARIDPKAR